MLDVLWSVPQASQILESDDIAHAPPGFMGNTGQQESLRDSVGLGKSTLGIRNVLENLQHHYQVEGSGTKWQRLDIRNDQPVGYPAGRGERDPLGVEVAAKELGARPPFQPSEHLAFSASSIQQHLDTETARKLFNRAEESPYRVSGNRIRSAVLRLSGSDIRGRHCCGLGEEYTGIFSRIYCGVSEDERYEMDGVLSQC